MKRELLNDVLSGLMVAATFAAVMPSHAWADLASATQNAEGNVAIPIVRVISYISYGLGVVMVIAGIAGVKKHSDAPGSNPLGPGLGKLGAGAAFLAAPAVAGMLQQTGQTTTGSGQSSFGNGITF
ncbi:MAG: hypothetical protein P4M15_13315 [Alphaproteobacteria bacterium]|nr:hypothetical protein [Alphaproteobacteria bacterium]